MTDPSATNYFSPGWEPAPLTHPAGAILAGNLLLFDTSEEKRIALQNSLQRSGHSSGKIAIVKAGSRFKAHKNLIFTINPDKPDHFQRLLDTLAREDAFPDFVAHLWSQKGYVATSMVLAGHLRKSLITFFHLTRTLLTRVPEKTIRLLYLFPGQGDGDYTGQPIFAAMAGLLKSLGLAYRRMIFKSIELHPKKMIDAELFPGILFPELAEDVDREIRYTPEGRFARGLQKIEEASEPKSLFVERGVYLITGGFDGRGAMAARFLGERYQAKLVLADPSPPNDERIAFLSELRAAGAEPFHIQSDISSRKETKNLVKEIVTRFGNLNGIVHAAEASRDGSVTAITKEDLETVIKFKLHGAIHLDEASKNLDIDLFLMYSILSAVHGNPDQPVASFANAFLDRFAEFRESLRINGKRFGNTLSANWPPPEPQLAKLAGWKGLQPIPLAAEYEILARISGFERHNTVIVFGDVTRVQQVYAPTETRREEAPLQDRPVETVLVREMNRAISIPIGTVPETPVLLFSGDTTIFESLSATGAELVWVRAGEGFSRVGDDRFTVSPGNPDDLEMLFSELGERLPRSIFITWSLGGIRLLPESIGALGFQTLFHLCKSLLILGKPTNVVFAYDTTGPGYPYFAALDGFARSVARENTELRLKILELETEFQATPQLLWAEMADPAVPFVRYQDNRRMAPAYQPVFSTKPKPPLKENGVYLITGGLVGLGLIFARFLAEHYRAKLVLADRFEPVLGEKETIEKMISLGAEVKTVLGNIAEIEDVRGVIQFARETFGGLDGIIHAAYTSTDSMLINGDIDRATALMAPKIQGALNLDIAVGDKPIDFFAVFSSTDAVFGRADRPVFAYANRFLDYFAQRRNNARNRHGQTLSINWPLWHGSAELRKTGATGPLFEDTGVTPLNPDSGLTAFELGLRSEESRIVVLAGDSEKIRKALDKLAGKVTPPVRPKSSNKPAAQPRISSLVLAPETPEPPKASSPIAAGPVTPFTEDTVKIPLTPEFTGREALDHVPPEQGQAGEEIIILSAKNEVRLSAMAGLLKLKLEDFLIYSQDAPSLRDIALTLQLERTPMHARLAVVAHSPLDLAGKLDAFLGDGTHPDIYTGFSEPSSENSEDSDPIDPRDRDPRHIAMLWARGYPIEWIGYNREHGGSPISLPEYFLD